MGLRGGRPAHAATLARGAGLQRLQRSDGTGAGI